MKLGQWPHFSDDEIDAAVEVLRSGNVNYWTGHHGKAFEQELSIRFNVEHALALANGTVALELALKTLGVKPGDEVVVTPRSYFASTGAVMAVGATPVFADVDLQSQNISPATIEPCLSPRTRAILPVHLAGWPCDMAGIMELAKRHGLKVIEDCAQAHGARWAGQAVGSFGDAAALSFCQDKIITTAGEGGALLTNQQDIFDAAWSLKEDGKSRLEALSSERTGEFSYIRERIGSNFRLSEVQSAVGRLQLGRLDQWLDVRRKYANIYTTAFRKFDQLRVVEPPEQAEHAYYQYYVFLSPELTGRENCRKSLLAGLVSDGIPCSSGASGEIYREKPVVDGGFAPHTALENAQALANSSIALPVHPMLTEDQIGWIIDRVEIRLRGL